MSADFINPTAIMSMHLYSTPHKVNATWCPRIFMSKPNYVNTSSLCPRIFMLLPQYVNASLCPRIFMSMPHYVNTSLCPRIFMLMTHYVNVSLCPRIFMSKPHYVNTSLCPRIFVSTTQMAAPHYVTHYFFIVSSWHRLYMPSLRASLWQRLIMSKNLFTAAVEALI